MAREFEKGVDQPSDRPGMATMFGISELRAGPVVPPGVPGKWVNRIMVFGDERLRDRIVELLKANEV